MNDFLNLSVQTFDCWSLPILLVSLLEGSRPIMKTAIADIIIDYFKIQFT